MGFQRLAYCYDLGDVTPTPEWFLGLMMTQVVPVVVLFRKWRTVAREASGSFT